MKTKSMVIAMMMLVLPVLMLTTACDDADGGSLKSNADNLEQSAFDTKVCIDACNANTCDEQKENWANSLKSSDESIEKDDVCDLMCLQDDADTNAKRLFGIHFPSWSCIKDASKCAAWGADKGICVALCAIGDFEGCVDCIYRNVASIAASGKVIPSYCKSAKKCL